MTLSEESAERARRLWEAKAEEWAGHTGEEGDLNRRCQSDPVLFRLLGEVAGREVLDAGCGSGYLSLKLARMGARVTGVDWSRGAVRLARERVGPDLEIDFRVDDCRELRTVPDGSVDAVVSNYVLMDLPDLDAACRAMSRALRPAGRAVVVINHPCLCPPGGSERLPDGSVRFRWKRSYFDEFEFQESWGPFSTPFQGYHRPLSRYWSAFRGAGLRVLEMEEPVVPAASPPAELSAEQVARLRMTPYSVAFRLER